VAVEIERKFLVRSDAWRDAAARVVEIRQGYVAREAGSSVRVRQQGDRFVLAIKADHPGGGRWEFEYPLPEVDGATLLGEVCRAPLVEKRRHYVPVGELMWEVDDFTGVNHGLVVAELELASWDQSFARPDWLGPEVTSDPRFVNARLYDYPFAGWGTSYADLVATLDDM